ncbi:MAG TPA: glycosyltransferase family 2 protein [Acidimicrobiales bacterium]|nr:glycosyltransferase family 2 protein [Acidimicrobiales bacterium]
MSIQCVRVVIVDHDGGELTTRCVESVRATVWTGSIEIVVVDNASSRPVAVSWPDVRTLRSDHNRGFAGGANLGIGAVSGVDAIALVNNDAVVDPGWLAPLVEALDADPSVGAACPKIRFMGGHRINNVGTILRDDWYGVDRGFDEPDDGQYDRREDVPLWCGGAVLLRAEYLGECGLFDERLFLYYEDVELGLRGRAAGWRFELVPSSVVEHEHSATAISGSDFAEYYKERNRLLVAARHAPLRVALWLPIRHLIATVSYAVHGERAVARRRLRSLWGYLELAPAMFRSRPGH